MLGSVLLALVVVVVFAAAGWAAWQFGAAYVPVESQRRLVAAGVAGGGVIVAVLVLLNRPSAPEIAEFVVVTDVNQGAVAYPVMIRQAGVQHQLQIAPQREGGEELGALRVRVILSDPQSAELVNEVVTIPIGETDIVAADGTTSRGIGWIPWSQNFSPGVTGFYEVALSLPPGSPRLRVRVGAPPTGAE